MKSPQLVIVTTALVTGFLLAQQIVAHQKVTSLTKGDDFAVMTVETAEFLKNIDKLEQEKNTLEEQKAKLVKSAQESQQAISLDSERLKILLGDLPVFGEGIEIQFDRPLVVSELTDLVNALRNIGTEAMTINDRRITAQSGFALIDGQAPLTVRAIGKKQLLKEAVSRRGGILDQIGHGSVNEHDRLVLPQIK